MGAKKKSVTESKKERTQVEKGMIESGRWKPKQKKKDLIRMS